MVYVPRSSSTPADARDSSGSPTAVSCPTTTWCVAVGGYNGPTGGASYAATLSAGVWRAAAIPAAGSLARLSGLSCPAVSGCVAVGQDSQNVNEAWKPLQLTLSGETWTGGALPIPSSVRNQSLASVSCATVTRCVAAGVQTLGGGATNAVVARLSGTTWSRNVLANPVGGQLGRLRSVSCGTTTCTAVGDARAGDGGLKPYSTTVALP